MWANDGGYKVAQEDTPMLSGKSVKGLTFDGTKATLVGSKNEVVGFQIILEPKVSLSDVGVKLNSLASNDFLITSKSTDLSGLFNFVSRNIEIFKVGYLPIKGLSALSYDTYDERHVPFRFQRAMDGNGVGTGSFATRPDANKSYPEILTPIEATPQITLVAGRSQAIWVDVYVPKTAPAGKYVGNFQVMVAGNIESTLPVELTVEPITLPDVTNSKTMLYINYADINMRYGGNQYPNAGTPEAALFHRVRDNHFKVAHRHKISLIDPNISPESAGAMQPIPQWIDKLNGQAFTPANGYEGPGEGVGNGVYSIGTYGSWGWSKDQATMQAKATQWENWFKTNSPDTERFLYLIDESTNYPQTEQWAGWVKPTGLPTFATIPLNAAVTQVPSLSIAASWFAVAPVSYGDYANQLMARGSKVMLYNGKRPASPSYATEDEGVALRIIPWIQHKKKIHRWFFWEGTYYNNYQAGAGQTNVWRQAKTFGATQSIDAAKGETGWNYCNGDGVLFYPGIDKVFPAESLGMEGPAVSYRLKMWRRGIQDVDYIAQAQAKDPLAVQAIMDRLMPKVLWENGVTVASDPTWWRGPVSWKEDADTWEQARRDIIAIIKR